MGAVFVVVAFIAAIRSIAIHQTVYNAVKETLPRQFQHPLTSRYVFPAFALSSSTSLSLQADYVKSLNGFCVMTFCVSLSFFSFRHPIFGCLFLIGSVVGVFKTIKSWEAYRDNCQGVDMEMRRRTIGAEDLPN